MHPETRKLTQKNMPYLTLTLTDNLNYYYYYYMIYIAPISRIESEAQLKSYN